MKWDQSKIWEYFSCLHCFEFLSPFSMEATVSGANLFMTRKYNSFQSVFFLSFSVIDPIFYSPQNITVVDQQPTPAYFQCISGDSLPVATISWEKDGKLLEEANQYTTMFGGSDSIKRSGTLQIDNVRTRHAGRYRCITTNELLPGQSMYSDYALLTVSRKYGGKDVALGKEEM